MTFSEVQFTQSRNITVATLDCMGIADAGDPACLGDPAQYEIFMNGVPNGGVAISLVGGDTLMGFTITVDAGTVFPPSGVRLVESTGLGNVVAALDLVGPSLPSNQPVYGLECGGFNQLTANQVEVSGCSDGLYVASSCAADIRNVSISNSTSEGIYININGDAGISIDRCDIQGAASDGIYIVDNSDESISLTNSTIETSRNDGVVIYGSVNFTAFSGNQIGSNDGADQIVVLPLTYPDAGVEGLPSQIRLGSQSRCGDRPNSVFNYGVGGGVLVDPRLQDAGITVSVGNTLWANGATAPDFTGLVEVVTVVEPDGGLLLVEPDAGRAADSCASDGGFTLPP